MRVVIQRVSEASVAVDNEVVGQIEKGFLVLLGVEEVDDKTDVDWLVRKLLGMRIFSDEEGKMNLDIHQASGSVLCVSQFTLHASTKKGNRPSFIRAATPDKAENLYMYFMKSIEKEGIQVQAGIFGANMQVALVNDGPVTIWLDSRNRE
jgi:D-tyrosyl-tRNA(Tyr) deacylase